MREGWQIKPLERVCTLFTDGNWIETKDQSSEGIRLIQTGNVGIGLFKDRKGKARYINQDTFGRLKCQEIVEGDCLVSRLPEPVGRACLIPDTGEKMITAVDCSILRFNYELIESQYFCYFSQSRVYLYDVEASCTGSTRKRISRKNLGKVKIPLPPLPEQKRIVAILDEAFEGIDAAIANTKKNLANARELFDSYLNDVFTKKGEGWVEKSLNDSCIVERGSSPRPIKAYLTTEEGGVNWVKIGDTKGITKYITDTKQKITKEGALRSRKVNSGDFILTNSMSYGKPYIMATSGYVHDGWFVLRLKDELNTDFFYHLLTSKVIQEQFTSLAAGSVVKNISGDLVKKTVLPIPPMEQQIDIVQAVELLSEETQRLETIYQQKLDSLNELKQSLLAKAFSGELTAQPEPMQKEAV